MLLVENFYNPVFGSRKRIIRALNDVDIDVTGYRYDEENNELYTQRMIENKIYELKFSEESDGTKKWLLLMKWTQNCIRSCFVM